MHRFACGTYIHIFVHAYIIFVAFAEAGLRISSACDVLDVGCFPQLQVQIAVNFHSATDSSEFCKTQVYF